MKNNKISIDLDLEDLLGLKENKNSLEYDLNFIIENGIDKYIEEQNKHQEEKEKFMELFRECFQEIVNTFRDDPREQIAVNCSGCHFANKKVLGYGKPTKRTPTNGK